MLRTDNKHPQEIESLKTLGKAVTIMRISKWEGLAERS